MRLRMALFALGLVAAQPAHADESIVVETEIPPAFAQILASRNAECAGFENGALTVNEGAIIRTDLDGDGTADWVLDETRLACSTAASLMCGTGGCTVNFLIGDVLTARLAKGWEVVPFPPMTVLLVQIHGVNCGGTNLNACVEAM
ncbi:MAG: hypothetical protein JNK88_07475, partial [Mangrovicoccus sp.]|nr:hypothetical protein [Mangrovicoccus sp.]